MKSKKRNIFFYTIDVKSKDSKEEVKLNEQEELLDQLFKKILNDHSLIIKMDVKEKTVMIHSIIFNNGTYEIIWRSCKYNHSPDYMNSDDGTTRASDKAVNEGEAELTHSIVFKDNHKYTIILERNQIGTSISEIKYYLIKMSDGIKKMDEADIECSKIVTDDIEHVVSHSKRIKEVDIYADIEICGSELLSSSILASNNFRRLGMIQLKAQRKKSLGISIFTDLIKNNKIKRLRAKIIDQSNTEQIIDTLNWSERRTISIDTNNKGVAISSSLMDELRSIMNEYLN